MNFDRIDGRFCSYVVTGPVSALIDYDEAQGVAFYSRVSLIAGDKPNHKPSAGKDGDITPPSINGFGFKFMPWTMYPGLLFRRHLSEPWFKPIARIGYLGRDEYPLDLKPDGESSSGPFTAEITARRSGEIFLFVNDAILPLPNGWQFFYNNNKVL